MTSDPKFPIERRLAFKCAAGAFWSVTRSIPSLAAASQEGAGRLDWSKFVDRIASIAELHARRELSSPSFVQRGAQVGAQLDLNDKSLAGACAFLRKRQASSHSPFLLAEAKREISFDVLLLLLDPGYSIPLHDHPNRSGVSLCVAGQAIVTNYDLQSGGHATLKLRSRSAIGPAQAGTLTESEGNIHTITAVQRVQIVDVFSPPPPASGGGFHWYKAEPDPKDRSILWVTSVS